VKHAFIKETATHDMTARITAKPGTVKLRATSNRIQYSLVGKTAGNPAATLEQGKVWALNLPVSWNRDGRAPLEQDFHEACSTASSGWRRSQAAIGAKSCSFAMNIKASPQVGERDFYRRREVLRISRERRASPSWRSSRSARSSTGQNPGLTLL
jgi:hypothetical protein